MKKNGFSRDFMLVVLGQIISLFGNAVVRFALPLHLLNISGSPTLYGMVSALAFLPLLIMSPLGGVIADRVNKRNIMVVLDFSTAGIILLFLLLSRQVNIVALILVALILLYSISGLYQPSVQASMPFLVPEEKLVQANAIINTVSSLAGLLGPVLGGIFYSMKGIHVVLAISMVCFFLSAVMEIFIRIPFTKRETDMGAFRIIFGDLKESVYFIAKSQKVIGKVTVIVAFVNLFISALLIIGLPVLCTQVFKFHRADPNQMYGYLSGIMAFGGIAGGIAAGILGGRIKIGDTWKLILGLALLMFPMGGILYSSVPDMGKYLVLAAGAFLIMLCATLFTVQTMSFVQMNTPGHLIGKVISWVMAIATCSQPLGQALYGVVFEQARGMEWAICMTAGIASIFVSLYLRRIWIAEGILDSGTETVSGAYK